MKCAQSYDKGTSLPPRVSNYTRHLKATENPWFIATMLVNRHTRVPTAFERLVQNLIKVQHKSVLEITAGFEVNFGRHRGQVG